MSNSVHIINIEFDIEINDINLKLIFSKATENHMNFYENYHLSENEKKSKICVTEFIEKFLKQGDNPTDNHHFICKYSDTSFIFSIDKGSNNTLRMGIAVFEEIWEKKLICKEDFCEFIDFGRYINLLIITFNDLKMSNISIETDE